jgi:hypothetical protein
LIAVRTLSTVATDEKKEVELNEQNLSDKDEGAKF